MHFISLACDNCSLASHHKIWYDLELDFQWPSHQGRAITLQELLMVLASDSGDYPKANLLYGVCENTSLVTTYNKKVVLPASKSKMHISFLVLGLCFLVEVGTINVDIGIYKKLMILLVLMILYISWVHQLADFE